MARITYVVSKPPAVPGPQGPTGPTGPEGPQGDPGPDTELRARVDPGSALDERTTVGADETGAPTVVGRSVSPLSFGAVGDGVTDDSAALADMIVRLGLTSAVSGVNYARGITIDGHNRRYAISDTFELVDIWFLTMRNFEFIITEAMADVLLLRGVSFSNFHNITISAQTPWSASDTADYAVRVETTVGDTTGNAVATWNTFSELCVIDLKFKQGVALGPNSANEQVSEIFFDRCHVHGQYNVNSPDATWYQGGFVPGSGTVGNILTFSFTDCTASAVKYPLHVRATQVNWRGGSLDQGEAAVFHSAPHPFILSGIRSEGCTMLLDTPGGTDNMPPMLLENIQYDANEANDDGSGVTYLIQWRMRSVLSVHGLQVSAVDESLTPKVRLSHASANQAQFVGISCPTPMEDFLVITGGTPGVTIQGYTETDHDGVPVTANTDLYLVAQTAIRAFTIGNPPEDASMYRKSSYPGMYFPARTFFGTSVEMWNDGAGSIMFRIRDAAGANDYLRIMDHGEIWLGDGTNAPDVLIKRGTGSPEGAETASPGSMFLSTNGNIYRKSTGTGNTGWVAM